MKPPVKPPSDVDFVIGLLAVGAFVFAIGCVIFQAVTA